MSTYEESGVNVSLGDKCSEIAYSKAKQTFSSREGMIGAPRIDDGGFTGALDMGDYYLVQNDDGVGSKMQIAEKCGKFDTLGYDLLAMVVDDAVCVGAEVISMTNTLDVHHVDPNVTEALMEGLKRACLEQKVVVPGGEIAELPSMINGFVWNATAVGIVKKDKMIKGDKVKEGDVIIGLYSPGFRSNGFSLVRHVLEKKFGENWHNEPYDQQISWGEKVLTPCVIFHDFILSMHGRFNDEATVEIKGVVHITGGGIPGNITRLTKKQNLGVKLDNLFPADDEILKLQEYGQVSDEEAYKTWNMNNGMMLVVDEAEAGKVHQAAKNYGLISQNVGCVTSDPSVQLISQGFFNKGQLIKFS